MWMKDLLIALVKVFERDQSIMWKLLQFYVIQGWLVRIVNIFYDNRESCIRYGMLENELFTVQVGLRQVCVKSLGCSKRARIAEKGAALRTSVVK